MGLLVSVGKIANNKADIAPLSVALKSPIKDDIMAYRKACLDDPLSWECLGDEFVDYVLDRGDELE